MGKPICAVPLPPELQRELPAGALVYSFDGEVVFRSKNPNVNQEPRTYSLMPVTDTPAMYERRWSGYPMQETYLSIEHFHGHIVTMFFFYLPLANEKNLVTGLSDRLLPMVKEAAQGSQLTKDLYSAAEKIIPGKEPASAHTHRAEAFAAMSWSTHQWLWVNSTLAAGFIFEPPMSLTKVVTKSIFTPNFVSKRLDRNDRNTTRIDAVVMYLRQQMNQQLQQNEAAGGRL